MHESRGLGDVYKRQVKGRGLDPKKVERAVNMTAEKYCSVSIMLSASVELTHDFEIVEEQE